MARSVWSGSLTFGLVTLPVALVTATESHTIRFHQVERGTSDRVRNKRVNERTGKEVPYDKIVKGYPAGDEEYVIVEPEELDEITPGRSKSIEIIGFADLDEIEPIYFDSTYFVQPKDESTSKVYGLLRDALEESNRAGIATMSMRQKEYLVAIHTEGGVIVMHTLHWADEVRDPHQTLDNLPSGSRTGPKELKMATQLVEAMAMDWDPDEYHDRTQERVRELVEAKQSGTTMEKSEPAPESTNVVDLMSALQASVDQAQEGRTGGTSESRKSAGTGTGKPARRSTGRGTKQGAKSGTKQGAKPGAKPATKQTAKQKASSRKASSSDDLGRLTKAELYDRAGEAGISGRSKMTRGELQKALSRASTSTRAKRRAS